jgi:transcriptional regulator with XRE-family HTH domain
VSVADDDPGRALRDLRLGAGVSQVELALRMGTTQSAVARLEAGRVSPSIRTLAGAYRALGHRLELAAVAPMEPAASRVDVVAPPAPRRPRPVTREGSPGARDALARLRAAGVRCRRAPVPRGAAPRVVYERTATNAQSLAVALLAMGARRRDDPDAAYAIDAWQLWAGVELELVTDAGDLDIAARG